MRKRRQAAHPGQFSQQFVRIRRSPHVATNTVRTRNSDITAPSGGITTPAAARASPTTHRSKPVPRRRHQGLSRPHEARLRRRRHHPHPHRDAEERSGEGTRPWRSQVDPSGCDRFGPSGDWPSGGNRPQRRQRHHQRAQGPLHQVQRRSGPATSTGARPSPSAPAAPTGARPSPTSSSCELRSD